MEHEIEIPQRLNFTRAGSAATLALFAGCFAPGIARLETFTLETFPSRRLSQPDRDVDDKEIQKTYMILLGIPGKVQVEIDSV